MIRISLDTHLTVPFIYKQLSAIDQSQVIRYFHYWDPDLYRYFYELSIEFDNSEQAMLYYIAHYDTIINITYVKLVELIEPANYGFYRQGVSLS